MVSIGDWRFLTLGALAAGLIAGCGGSGGDDGGDGGGASEVSVVDSRFLPRELSVKVGETVRWTWSGRLPHQVVGDFGAGEVKSEEMTGAGTFDVTFPTAGRFEYECGVHGNRMPATIVVE